VVELVVSLAAFRRPLTSGVVSAFIANQCVCGAELFIELRIRSGSSITKHPQKRNNCTCT
jgi:hypothetical protein